MLGLVRLASLNLLFNFNQKETEKNLKHFNLTCKHIYISEKYSRLKPGGFLTCAIFMLRFGSGLKLRMKSHLSQRLS